MPIEGALREFGIHDVFQLLDLSRKTGMLRVKSELRNDDGIVYFDKGRVVHARIKSKPVEIPEATTERELDRLMRQQIETVVFELMSWREGVFSFEERELGDVGDKKRIQVATESLLMEGARRIDEWSRIADKIPNLAVVPVLASVSAEHETQLDLLPHEWEVLTMIDGERDLRAIASALGRSEFEVAKVAYGLVTTGVVEIRQKKRVSVSIGTPVAAVDPAVERARFLGTSPGRAEALAELRQLSRQHPTTAEVHLELGYAAVRAGDFKGARTAWENFLKLAPAHPVAARVKSALEAATALLNAIEGHGNG
jgi:uncharacterized protein DUF4388